MANASNEEIRILTPSGMLGYGFPVDHFKLGLALQPHAITTPRSRPPTATGRPRNAGSSRCSTDA